MAAAAWTSWIEPIGWLLALACLPMPLHLQGRSRLHIDEHRLRFVSGFPAWLDKGAWRSWTLAFSDVARVDLVGPGGGRAYGPQPLLQVALQFVGHDGRPLHRLRLAQWHLAGEAVRPRLKSSTTWLGVQLGTWASDEDKRSLARAYDALPVVQGLRRRGIAAPAWGDARGTPGDDLFDNPSMKALILLSFALAPLYFVGAFLLREYWVVAPPWEFWLLLGLIAALSGALWMRGARSSPDTVSHRSPPPMDARAVAANQTIVAGLFGLAVVGAAMAALPLVDQWLFPAADVVYVVRPDATLEPVVAADGLPTFRPRQSIDFWASRKPGAHYTLRMRKLPWGYWQYGVDAFRPEIEAFEDPPGR
jgi:hypothetical protein